MFHEITTRKNDILKLFEIEDKFHFLLAIRMFGQ